MESATRQATRFHGKLLARSRVWLCALAVLGACGVEGMVDGEAGAGAATLAASAATPVTGRCFGARPDRPATDCLHGTFDLVDGSVTQSQCSTLAVAAVNALPPETIDWQCSLQWFPNDPPPGSWLWIAVCWEDGNTHRLTHVTTLNSFCR